MNFRYLQTFLCFFLLLALGCDFGSGDIGAVEGTIKLDGVPLEQATIAFYPLQGRASTGRTDAEGHYSLTYTRTVKGALIGPHKVTISTEVAPEVEYGDSDYMTGDGRTSVKVVSRPRKESMPPKYRDLKATELTGTVERGSNTIDFDLSK